MLRRLHTQQKLTQAPLQPPPLDVIKLRERENEPAWIMIISFKMRRQVFLYVFEFSEQRRNGYPGYQRFFLACVGEVRFVGRRPTRVRPKAEDMSCEAARKPETAHEKPLAPRVRNSQL